MAISLRDYAKQAGVSYESIRKQVQAQQHKALRGHVHKVGRTRMLDDVAVEWLDQHRAGNPVVVQQQDAAAELQELRTQNTALMAKVTAQAEQIAALYAAIADSKDKLLLAEKAAQDALQAAAQAQADKDAAESKSWLQKLLGR